MIAATATRTGSGNFFTFQINPMVSSAISAVITSTMDRSARTMTAPVMAAIAAALQAVERVAGRRGENKGLQLLGDRVEAPERAAVIILVVAFDKPLRQTVQ